MIHPTALNATFHATEASRFLGVAGGYWRVVGEGFSPPFSLLLVLPWAGGKRKVAALGLIECWDAGLMR